MTRLTPLMTTFVALALALGTTAGAFGSVDAKPSAKEEGDKFVLANDHVTIWFQGKKPMLHVFPTTDANNTSAGFGYHFTGVVEFRDVDGDGAPSPQEVVSRLDLHQASGFAVDRVETEEGVTLNLTLEDDVKLGGNGGPLQQANVTLDDRAAAVSLVFHLRDAPATLDLNGTVIEVPETSVKYDFLVAKWPWLDASTNRLALEMQVTGDLEADLDGDVGAAAVDANGTEVGILTWVTTAEATAADGATFDVPVEAHLEAVENGTRIAFVYDGAGYQTLYHDPTIGVASTGAGGDGESTDPTGGMKDIPAPGIVAGLAGVALAGYAIRRRHA